LKDPHPKLAPAGGWTVMRLGARRAPAGVKRTHPIYFDAVPAAAEPEVRALPDLP
jgi:hypothetical protein